MSTDRLKATATSVMENIWLFYWERVNGMIVLPSNGKNSIERVINNHGQIVGENDGPVMWKISMSGTSSLLAGRS